MLIRSEETARSGSIYRQSELRSPYDHLSFARRFWVFQNERIPLIPIAIMATLVTGAVAHANHHFVATRFGIASAIIAFYFLEIRLADEPKDYEHDCRFYPDRPVQRGLVTLQELAATNKVVIVTGFLLGVFTRSPYVLLLACTQQAYAFLTRREFYVREWLRRRFVLYQFSHYLQLLLLDWLVLTILEIRPAPDKWLFFAFTLVMIFIVESSRTIGGTDGVEANDRYAYVWGTSLALVVHAACVAIGIALTIKVIHRTNGVVHWPLLVGGAAIVACAVGRYWKVSTLKRAFELNAVSLLMYLCATATLLLS